MLPHCGCPIDCHPTFCENSSSGSKVCIKIYSKGFYAIPRFLGRGGPIDEHRIDQLRSVGSFIPVLMISFFYLHFRYLHLGSIPYMAEVGIWGSTVGIVLQIQVLYLQPGHSFFFFEFKLSRFCGCSGAGSEGLFRVCPLHTQGNWGACDVRVLCGHRARSPGRRMARPVHRDSSRSCAFVLDGLHQTHNGDFPGEQQGIVIRLSQRFGFRSSLLPPLEA